MKTRYGLIAAGVDLARCEVHALRLRLDEDSRVRTETVEQSIQEAVAILRDMAALVKSAIKSDGERQGTTKNEAR